ncbi:MAG: sugar ABC transporter permease [Oscillatoriales cyanobacterium SM2_1_8]|nr:sugar ABC transporter permease [Oscillatoriales cyanobacterium SM2_1_8]
MGVAIGMLLPAFGGLAVFVGLPVLYLLYLSLTDGHLTMAGVRWVGWAHYGRLLTNPDFWQVATNTAVFTVFTVGPGLALALALAIALDRPLRGRGLLRSLYFLPSVVSVVAAGLGWRWLVQPDGIINRGLGWQVAWLGQPGTAMAVLVVVSVWQQLGFNLVVFLAGLQAIPASRYEAASLDGAGPWQQFRWVTWPGLRPTTAFATVSTVIFTLRSFEQVYVLTGGGPLNSTNLLVYYTYEQAFGLFDFGYGAAAAMVLLAIAVGGTLGWRRWWQGAD